MWATRICTPYYLLLSHGLAGWTIYPGTLVQLVRNVSTPQSEGTVQGLELVYSAGLSDAVAETYTSAITILRLQPAVDTTDNTSKDAGRGLFGITWFREAQAGDRVCLVHGCSRPLIVRPQKVGGREECTLLGAVLFPGPDSVTHPVIAEVMAHSRLSDIHLC